MAEGEKKFRQMIKQIWTEKPVTITTSSVLTTYCFQIVITAAAEHSATKFIFCSAEERLIVGRRTSVSVQLSLHPYILHAEGQPWTANLPRWRERSLHLVNMQIRWEGEMRDTWGMMDRGWRLGRGEGNADFLVPFRWENIFTLTVSHCPALIPTWVNRYKHTRSYTRAKLHLSQHNSAQPAARFKFALW